MACLPSHLVLPPIVSLLLTGLVLGCNPKIGDDCSTSTNCSVSGERLCDTTQPGGYCTIFNCEPDNCPDEAQCVAFNTELDPMCNDQRWARFERTFCMRRCSDNGDCRSRYICADMNAPFNPWGARVADFDPKGSKVCIAPFSGSIPGEGLTEVCGPYEGEFPDAGSVAIPQEPDASFEDALQDITPENDGEVDVDMDGDPDEDTF